MTACPYCHQEIDERTIAVSGETVVDIREEWLVDSRSHKPTQKLIIVCVEKERTHEILPTGRRTGNRQSQAASLFTGHRPVPALPADVSTQEGQTKLSVLQEAAR